MRALLLLVAVLLCAPARADLVTAQLAYQKADYERAFKDYRPASVARSQWQLN
jgi:hypothetical protein